VETFVDMVEYVKQEYENLCENKSGPLTVHCFGGIGSVAPLYVLATQCMQLSQNNNKDGLGAF